jgi:hypothetical protein
MIFRLCEHYYDNELPINNLESINECFICFEYKNDDGVIPIYLNTQKLYLNGCICNGSVHNQCLKIWVDKTKQCPICRIKVIQKNNNTVIIYNYIPFGITIYTYTKKIILAAVKVFSCILFLFLFIDFYFMVLNTKYKRYNDYTYRQIPILDEEHIE